MFQFTGSLTYAVVPYSDIILASGLSSAIGIILNFNIDSKDYAVFLLVDQTAFINQLQGQTHDAL
jgi:hypothetical protein